MARWRNWIARQISTLLVLGSNPRQATTHTGDRPSPPAPTPQGPVSYGIEPLGRKVGRLFHGEMPSTGQGNPAIISIKAINSLTVENMVRNSKYNKINALMAIKSALAALFLLFAGAALAQQEVTFPKDELTIQGAGGKIFSFNVELALTDAQRAHGLMFRKQMPPDQGMLFDFGTVRPVSMWMENTPLPLDMLFIQGDGTISHIRENAVPYSRDVIDSRGPVKFVLEINGGRARSLGIKVGDKVISRRIGNKW